MNLELIRIINSYNYTEGVLNIDGNYFCHTLELPWENNTPQKSCIPVGEYDVDVERSNHFSEKFGTDIFLPCVKNVPGREGVEIHGGNSPSDSLGCILVGAVRIGPGLLAQSKSQELRALLQNNPGPHKLTVTA